MVSSGIIFFFCNLLSPPHGLKKTMKVFLSPLPELTLKYKTTNQKKVKIKSSEDAYHIFKTLYSEDTIEYWSYYI